MVLIMNFILIQMVIKDQIKAAKIHSMFGLIIMDKLFHMEELNTQNIKILTIFYGQTAVLLIGLKNLLILNLVPVLLLITDTKYSMHIILYKKRADLIGSFLFLINRNINWIYQFNSNNITSINIYFFTFSKHICNAITNKISNPA